MPAAAAAGVTLMIGHVRCFDSGYLEAKRLIDWDYLVECELIGPNDLDLITFCDTAEDGWAAIGDFYAAARETA